MGYQPLRQSNTKKNILNESLEALELELGDESSAQENRMPHKNKKNIQMVIKKSMNSVSGMNTKKDSKSQETKGLNTNNNY